MPKYVNLERWKESRLHEKLALSMIDRQEFSEAAVQLKNMLKISPENCRAYYLMGMVEKRLGNKRKGLELQKYGSSLNEHFCQLYAIIQDNHEKSEKNDQNFIANFKEMNNRISSIEKKIYESKSYSAMIRDCSSIAEIYTGALDYQSARIIMEVSFQILQMNIRSTSQPVQRGNLTQQGMITYDAGLYRMGANIIQYVEEEQSNQYVYLNNLSILRYLLGQNQRCQNLTKRSLAVKPGYPRTLYIKSFMETKKGNAEAALIDINSCISSRERTAFYVFKKLCILALCYDALPEPFEQTLKTSEKFVTLVLKNDDSNLFKEKYQPFVKRVIFLIKEWYEKFGFQGIKQLLFQKYLSKFDDFLIGGDIDRLRIRKILLAYEDNLRKIKQMPRVEIEPPKEVNNESDSELSVEQNINMFQLFGEQAVERPQLIAEIEQQAPVFQQIPQDIEVNAIEQIVQVIPNPPNQNQQAE